MKAKVTRRQEIQVGNVSSFTRLRLQQLRVHIPTEEAWLHPVRFPLYLPMPYLHRNLHSSSTATPFSTDNTVQQPEPTLHSPLTPPLLLMFLLKSRRWPEGGLPDETTQQEGPVALDFWGRGEQKTLPPTHFKKQGSQGHFETSLLSRRSRACLDGKSPNLIHFSATPVFMICISVGAFRQLKQKAVLFRFLYKSNTRLNSASNWPNSPFTSPVFSSLES